MGKIVMPKNSALLEEVEAVLKIYYEAGCWISNDEYKRQLKAMIGDDQYASSYTKKAQITSYFGFTEWEDITNARSMRRITERGKSFYENLRQKNESGIFEDLMQSLEKTTFGRNNFGCPDSNSDVEPPVLFVRAIMDLGYLTYKEFAFLLWKLEDCGGNYTDVKAEIKAARSQMTFDIPEAATKYTDAKPIMVLVRWGFLAEDTNAVGAKHIVINSKVRERYQVRLQNLKIYNIDKDIDDSEEQNKRENQNGDDVLMVENSAQKKDYTINELGAILAEMYNKATSKTAAIHIFGIKYGEVIKKLGYSATALVAAAKLNDAYHAEVSKGLRIYEAFYANEYGIKFYDGECTEHQATHTLPVCSPRERKTYPLNCILYGAPGTGKTYATAAYALAVAENKELKEVERESRDLIMQRYTENAPCQKTGRCDPLLLWFQSDCGTVSEAWIPHRYRRLCPPVGGTGEGFVGSDSLHSSGPDPCGNRCSVYPALLQGCDPAEASAPCSEHLADSPCSHQEDCGDEEDSC